MTITSVDTLRSLRHEAGRQGQFFSNRGKQELASFWFELESLAHTALTVRESMCILLSSDLNIPPIINDGE